MKNTQLYELHQKLGATFGGRHGEWNLAVQFTNPIEEHNAVRNSVGISDISFLGTFCLTGEDRATFLHRLISNDVENLLVGEGNYATLLTNRGKIIADLKVYIFEDTIYISTAPECIEQAFAELDKYIIADDVELSVVSDKVGAIAVYGPESPELVESVLGLKELRTLSEYHSLSCEIEDQWVGCVRSNTVGEFGYHLYTTTDRLEWLWNKMITAKSDVVPVGWDALESLRIEAGIPRFGAELSDAIFPLEAELEHAIDFEKGCYIGQEIVARMKYRGHPNRLLRGIIIEAEKPIQQNSPIVDGGKEIGWITSSVYAPTLKQTIAIGYVRMAYTEKGSRVQIKSQKDNIYGTVV
ncbi:aminomethyl transferase family protein, partial [Candidatus Poribacteria bacterium]|nr:aminomethyl transferase family protein [Candidatus Poribacteria bacterium]